MLYPLRIVLLIIAVACFVCGALGIPSKLSWESLGLAFFAGAFLVP